MFITGLGTATPPHRYTQRQCWDALCAWPRFSRLAAGSRQLLRKVLLSDNGIESRHLALNPLSEAFELTPDALAARFARNGPVLAALAAERALARAGVAGREIDALVVTTCTGYLCPGLASYVHERLGLRVDVLALDLVGQGCGAALPALQTAEALLATGRYRQVLGVSVEICSAALFFDDDPGVLVSACLFGDGAGAAVLSGQPRPGGRRIEWIGGCNRLSPADRDYLRFELRGGMLRNILKKEVPILAARQVRAALAETLARSNLDRGDITTWILHPGGRNVLLAMQDQLGLRDEDLRWSAGVLREHGNLSSATVLFALQAAVDGGAPGGYWWIAAFGAGFSCHGAWLKVD